MRIPQSAGRTVRKVQRRLREIADSGRRRTVANPRLAGLKRKGHVVIGEPKKITEDGNTTFQADFVLPGMGSQLAPFLNHVVAVALETGANQLALAALKKFENIEMSGLRTIEQEFKWKQPVAPSENVRIQLREKIGPEGIDKSRTFKCTYLGGSDGNEVLAEGKISLEILKGDGSKHYGNAAKIADLFRRRKTAKPHMVAYPRRSQVVISDPVKITIDGKNAFQAELVRPRKGSQLEPIAGDIPNSLIETGVHQLVISSSKQFGNMKGKAFPAVFQQLKRPSIIPAGERLIIQVWETTQSASRNRGFMWFNCRLVSKENPEKVFVEGKLTVAVINKK